MLKIIYVNELLGSVQTEKKARHRSSIATWIHYINCIIFLFAVTECECVCLCVCVNYLMCNQVILK